MFIECKACAGDGEGVYGHSWTVCPVCNGAGQVFDPSAQPVRVPQGQRRPKPECFVGVRPEDVNPTGMFPDPTYRKRELATA